MDHSRLKEVMNEQEMTLTEFTLAITHGSSLGDIHVLRAVILNAIRSPPEKRSHRYHPHPHLESSYEDQNPIIDWNKLDLGLLEELVELPTETPISRSNGLELATQLYPYAGLEGLRKIVSSDKPVWEQHSDISSYSDVVEWYDQPLKLYLAEHCLGLKIEPGTFPGYEEISIQLENLYQERPREIVPVLQELGREWQVSPLYLLLIALNYEIHPWNDNTAEYYRIWERIVDKLIA